MNIAIVDDSKNDVQKLIDYIGMFFNGSLVNTIIKTYSSGEDFLRLNLTNDIDVIFLDIFMQEINGIDVAKKIRETNTKCLIVFVTSYNNFATESYQVDALQYMVKPYDYKQFNGIMQKVDDKIKKNACYFDLKQKNETKRITLSKIIYVDYYNHYIQIHTQEEIIKSYTVTFLDVSETLLHYKNFILCYRNVLINMDKVAKIDGKLFIMLNGDSLPINRDKFKEIKQEYHTYLFAKMEE